MSESLCVPGFLVSLPVTPPPNKPRTQLNDAFYRFNIQDSVTTLLRGPLTQMGRDIEQWAESEEYIVKSQWSQFRIMAYGAGTGINSNWKPRRPAAETATGWRQFWRRIACFDCHWNIVVHDIRAKYPLMAKSCLRDWGLPGAFDVP